MQTQNKEDDEYLDFDEENEEKKTLDQNIKTENVKSGYVL